MSQLAFYKAKNGTWADKLIAWWTKSEFSHVELIHEGWWYSTSPRDGEVRRKRIVYNEDNWKFVDVELDEEWLAGVFSKTKGQKYDWINIFLTQVVPLGIENKEKWICSEWCGYVLFKEEQKVSPEDLYIEIKD